MERNGTRSDLAGSNLRSKCGVFCRYAYSDAENESPVSYFYTALLFLGIGQLILRINK